MGFYCLDLDELSKYTGNPVTELKQESYSKLESMIEDMKKDKILKQNNRNAEDKEFERLVKKFFTPMEFLKHWFSEKEIVLACALTGVTEKDLCEEALENPGQRGYWSKCGEYLRTSWEYVPQYDRQGRQLMESERKEMDVYRIKNHHQGLCHGKVISHLLYGRYPEFEKYDFKCYECQEDDYEIYLDDKNLHHIYVSFTALMTGDVNWIIHRTQTYWGRYDKGRYEKVVKAEIESEEAAEFFHLIEAAGKQERKIGHPGFHEENGKYVMANGMEEIKTSESGLVRFVEYKKKDYDRSFKLIMLAPCHVSNLVNAFLCMVDSPGMNAVIHIRQAGHNIDDGDPSEIDLEANDCAPKFDWAETFEPLSDYIVTNAFGTRNGNVYDLILRIDKK